MPAPLLTMSSPDVLVETVKVSDDGKGFIVRLFGVSGRDTAVSLRWGEPGPKRQWLSDLSEQPRQPVTSPVLVPANGVVTLRADGRGE